MPALNKHSNLLSYEENSLVFSMLGERCQSLATTVVQKYIARKNTFDGKWLYSDVGVICFVKDSHCRSYFFRIYCPNKRILLWEHELYNFIEYLKLDEYLHAFEAEDGIVAFNFASISEGDFFFDLVQSKLRNRGKPSDGNRNNKENCLSNTPPSVPTITQVSPVVSQPSWTAHIGSKLAPGLTGENKKKQPLIKISKDMIGAPMDFRHLSHFGFDNTPNFNLLEDDSFQTFFKMARVSDKQLQDPSTCRFIYQFIEDNGGVEAVKNDIAPVVPSAPPPHMVSRYDPFPPLPPCNVPPLSPCNVPPSPPLSNIPPPPLPNIPPPPPLSNIPPPPPLSNFPPPPPLSSAPSSGLPVDPKAALMQSIKSGTTLKHVSTGKDDHDLKGGVFNESDGRGELLEQIRHGVKLHAVSKNDEQTPKRFPVQGALAAALADALAKRSTVIHSDSESETSSSDNEEWDEE